MLKKHISKAVGVCFFVAFKQKNEKIFIYLLTRWVKGSILQTISENTYLLTSVRKGRN